MLKIILHYMINAPLAHKTRKNTIKNWIKFARAPKLSLFKSILQYCGIKVICFNSFIFLNIRFIFRGTVKLDAAVRAEEEALSKIFLYFFARLQAKKYEINFVERPMMKRSEGIYLYFS